MPTSANKKTVPNKIVYCSDNESVEESEREDNECEEDNDCNRKEYNESEEEDDEAINMDVNNNVNGQQLYKEPEISIIPNKYEEYNGIFANNKCVSELSTEILDTEGYFGRGKYGEIEVIMVLKDNLRKGYKKGFINATKLCKLGNKKYYNWPHTEEAIIANKFIKKKNNSDEELSFVVKGGNKIMINLSGTYVHIDLIPSILNWISPEFFLYSTKILNFYYINIYKKVIDNLEYELQTSKNYCDKLKKKYELMKTKATSITFDDKSKAEGYFYLISDGKYTKIGYAYDVKTRLSTLQTGNAKKLKIIYKHFSSDPEKIEIKFLKMYSDKKISGEWHYLSDKNINYIKSYLDSNGDTS